VDTSADTGTTVSLSQSDALVNSSESGAVSFTVANMDADAIGVVTFRDAANATVTANVSSNGSATANLSALQAGTITSTLVVTDVADNTSTVNGPSFTLDKSADLADAVTVTINDSNGYTSFSEKASVSYTLANVDADAQATVTFTSSTSGTPIVVTGQTNGTFTVDLTALGDGTITAAVEVTDTAANTASGTGDTSIKDVATPIAGNLSFASLTDSTRDLRGWG